MNNDELSEYCVVEWLAKAFSSNFLRSYNDFPALFQAFLFLVVSRLVRFRFLQPMCSSGPRAVAVLLLLVESRGNNISCCCFPKFYSMREGSVGKQSAVVWPAHNELKMQKWKK